MLLPQDLGTPLCPPHHQGLSVLAKLSSSFLYGNFKTLLDGSWHFCCLEAPPQTATCGAELAAHRRAQLVQYLPSCLLPLAHAKNCPALVCCKGGRPSSLTA